MLGIVKYFLYILVMSENIEIWKPVVGYEGLYEVSNLGNVRSLDKITADGRRIKGKILKTQINNSSGGYKQAHLYNKDGVKTFKVSRLVAIAFIPNPENKPCVDHINTNRTDDTVWLNEDGSINYEKTNLRWVTPKENSNNPLTLSHFSRGNKHPKAGLGKFGKLNGHSRPIMQYTKEGVFIREWECSLQIQRELGIWGSNITKCCKGGYKSTGGYIWKYKEVA